MLDRRQVPLVGAFAVAAAIAGCITVHVYFPVKQLRQAADEIVGEVRPDIAGVETPPPENETPERPDEPANDPGDHVDPGADESAAHVRARSAWPALLYVSLMSTAGAAEENPGSRKDGSDESDDVITTSSPKIEKIKASLKARYGKLLPLYTAGRIGEDLEGFLALRDVKDLDLKERRDVNTLVKAENADRQNLYATIARENEIPDAKIRDIGRLFSRSWQKQSKPGWWIEVELDQKGTERKRTWVRKPKAPEKSASTAKSSGAAKPGGAA